MYFYCWVEICTNDIDCAQRCAFICEYFAVCLHYMCRVHVAFNCACPPTASEGDRQRREATPESYQVKLVSLGPLLPGQNNTEQDDNPCVKQDTSKSCSAQNYSYHVMNDQYLNVIFSLCFSVFKVTVYVLSGVGAALLLILLFMAVSRIRKCRTPEAEQARDAKVDGEESE